MSLTCRLNWREEESTAGEADATEDTVELLRLALVASALLPRTLASICS
jgi:hypothetical protein